MKNESATFTRADLRKFFDELHDHERQRLADRLETASSRLGELGPRVNTAAGADGWSAHEVLAHIAVLSKAYGVTVHRISSGQLTELDLLSYANLRDTMGEQMVAIEPAELIRMAMQDHARTIKILRTADAESLAREAKLEDGRSMSALDVARLPLVGHLELHIAQLERALG
jgi:hypothetical protein